MSTKREPVGVRCTPIKQGNGTYYVHMRRSDGSRPHSDGEYFANGRFTVQRKPDGDIVRAVLVVDDDGVDVVTLPQWWPLLQNHGIINSLFSLDPDFSSGQDVTFDVQWSLGFDGAGAPDIFRHPWGLDHVYYVEVSVDGGAYAGNNTSPDLTPQSEGPYTVHCVAATTLTTVHFQVYDTIGGTLIARLRQDYYLLANGGSVFPALEVYEFGSGGDQS